MKTPVDTFATDVGAPREKGPRSGTAPERPDISDPDQVFDLAARMAKADRRVLMGMTLDEQRAICAFAVRMGVIASNAIEFVRLREDPATSNSPEVTAQYLALAKAVTP